MKYVFLIIFIILVIVILSIIKKKSKRKNNDIIESNFDEKKPLELEEEIKELYLNIENALTNFDYDYLHNNLSDSLYEEYKNELDRLKKYNKRLIRENIAFIDYKVIKSTEEKLKVTIGLYEDKYTLLEGSQKRIKGVTYESYYDLEIDKNKMVINDIKLVYSHSKR